MHKTLEQQNNILLSLVMALRQAFIECGEDQALKPRGAIRAIDQTLLRVGSQAWLDEVIAKATAPEPAEPEIEAHG